MKYTLWTRWMQRGQSRPGTGRRTPTRRRVRLSLEILEDRTVPTAPTPNLSQALFSLYLDGAVLELNNLASEFIHGDNFNIDNYFGTPDQLAVVRANASAAGVNFDAIQPLLGNLTQFTGHTVLNSVDDLHFNYPYAGPFGLFAIAAGSAAADQAVRL